MDGIWGGDGRLEATGYGGAHPSTVSNVNSRAFHPETLILLQQVYDECLKELVTIFEVSEPSELNGIKDELALRIVVAFEEGMADPKEIQALALHGLSLDWRAPPRASGDA
jgi:hypothetical protein